MLFTLTLVLNCLVHPANAAEFAKPPPVVDQQLESGIDATARDGNCLQPQVVDEYSSSSAVVKMTQKPPKTSGVKSSMSAVFQALDGAGMVKHHKVVNTFASEETATKMDDTTPEATKNFGSSESPGSVPSLDRVDVWLKDNGFTNIKDCGYWNVRLDRAKDIPKGAVVLYRERNGGPVSAVEIATPSGFWSDKPRTQKTFRDPKNLEVAGVYVRPNY